MFDAALDRRQFLGATALAGAIALSPSWAWARETGSKWTGVQALLDGYVAEDKLPGAAGAIGRGLSDPDFVVAGKVGRGRDRAVDGDTLYRVYSMSKPITAMAAMMLIEEGKLRLDQNVGDFIPGFKKPMVIVDQMVSLDAKPATKPVTIRGLMTHSSGLGYIITSKGKLLEAYAKEGLIGGVVSRSPIPGLPDVKAAPTLAAFADRIATLPLMYEPGTQWSYSAGLDVLGRVIEIVSGMPFDRFLQTRVFDPLGMKSSFFHVPVSELPRLVTNYGVLGSQQFPMDGGTDSIYTDTSTLPLGGGGLVMSPRDYDRFLLMLAGKGAIGSVRILKPETVALAMSNLLQPGVATAGTMADGQGFGAGGRVTTNPTPGGAGIGTYGWGGAAATIAFVDPTRGIRASGFAQFMPSEAMPFTKDFARSVYAGL